MKTATRKCMGTFIVPYDITLLEIMALATDLNMKIESEQGHLYLITPKGASIYLMTEGPKKLEDAYAHILDRDRHGLEETQRANREARKQVDGEGMNQPFTSEEERQKARKLLDDCGTLFPERLPDTVQSTANPGPDDAPPQVTAYQREVAKAREERMEEHQREVEARRKAQDAYDKDPTAMPTKSPR